MAALQATTSIEFNDQFRLAADAVARGQHIFITGKAGTGKSTLLGYIREKVLPGAVVLAPTGVAAVNIGGQTIHSFFGFRPDITVEKVRKNYKKIRNAALFKKLSTLIIDEISMVRADLLDCIDTHLRMHGPLRGMPFGGIQMVFIGDLYQLPPVVTGDEREIFAGHYPSPYFFDSRAFGELSVQLVELEKIYRQSDTGFIEILNGIRNRSVTDAMLTTLNKRVNTQFRVTDSAMHVHLVTTNARAGQINEEAMYRLPGKRYIFSGVIQGQFDEKSLPAPRELALKTGAQVMLTNNDHEGRWINGTMGKVRGIYAGDEGEYVSVALETGETVDVWPNTWDMFRFRWDGRAKRIESETIGSYIQFPLMLAWAMTIHKSQGKTFPHVVVDMDRGAFAHGQTYVALSRAVSLDGLILIRPIEKRHVLLDWRVVRFLTRFQYRQAAALLPDEEKIRLLTHAKDAGGGVSIVYLKADDTKSRRTIRPTAVGTMEYLGKQFAGVCAYDHLRGEERVFRLDRILAIEGAE